MKTSSQYCYLNGNIIPLHEAMVSVYDIGLLRGYGVYDGLAAFGKSVFRLQDHLRRFRNSAHLIGLEVPATDSEIEEALHSLIEKHNFTRTNIRMILTGGNTREGIYPTLESPTFYILAEEWQSLPAEYYIDGATLITHEFQRDIPEAKTTNYIEAVKMQPQRIQAGAVEILFVHSDRVLECATSNIFAFIGDTLVTPSRGVLGGITRMAVLELAQGLYKVEERDLSVSELTSAREVFITSSYKDIVPVVSIDGTQIGDGVVGPRTHHLMDLFQGCIKSVSLV